MASRIYSTRFLLASLSTALGLSATYTVPAGKVAILRWAQGSGNAPGTALRLRVTPPPGSSIYQVVWFTTVSNDAPQQWSGSVVCNAGDVISAINATAGSSVCTIIASGYLLTV